MKNFTFLMYNHTGFGNRGCEAMAKVTAKILFERFEHSTSYLLSNHAENDIEENDVATLKIIPTSKFSHFGISRKLEILKAPEFFQNIIKNLCWGKNSNNLVALAMGGDSYSMDYGAPDIFFDQSLITQKIPVVVWASSIGPFSNQAKIVSNMKSYLNQTKLICARESITEEILKEIGITTKVVRVYDTAFLLEPVEYLGQGRDFVKNGDVIGINLSPLIVNWRNDKNINNLIFEYVDFIRSVVSDGFKVLLIPHVEYPGRININDRTILKKVIEVAALPDDKLLLLPGFPSANELRWIISQCKYFFGARFHSLVDALSTGVPTISIAYSIKTRGINIDIFGHLNSIIEVPDISSVLLKAKLYSLINQEDNIRKYLRDKKPQMVEGANKNFDALAELLESLGK